ncbi:fatty acid hydroperoxide lyase, chloroplastic-like [Branchiostoma floridae]|uniref:sterol 22-desaturase n=1 Tax=Branchiostoma floridae TaxID=7739 RepID=A0A9J7MX03_BRAFL|nr:fatty acid hydroperoxide lyase, chloroplastic-like [Branchiostoma floridae]
MGGVWSNTYGFIKGVTDGVHMMKPEGEHPSVVRTNPGLPVVALMNQDTIQYALNPETYKKEPYSFGPVGVSKDVLRGHCPSMFSNDEDHRRKKALLVDAYKQGEKSLSSILFNQIKAHFGEWSRLKDVPDFEERVFHIMSETLTEALFGRKIDGQLCFTWLNGLITEAKTWIPMPSLAWKRRQAIKAIPELLKAIETAPKYRELVQLCHTHGVEVEEGIFTILYGTLFNGCAAQTAAIVSSVARLHTLSDAEKNEIIQTTLQVLEKHGGVSEESLGDMKTLESFILEVLRLHPPVFNYWVLARKDLVISPEKENIKVCKGERMLGCCFFAQRDGSVFPDPDRFRWNRFLDEQGGQKKHLFFPRGSFMEAADLNSHQCPGQDIGFFMMKTTLSVLLCYCSWELKDAPVWSDKPIRVGNPDDPVRLVRFNFRSEQAGRALVNTSAKKI